MKDVEVILRDGGLYTITEEQITYWTYLFPNVNVLDEIQYLKMMWEIKGMPRKTAKNVNKFIVKWLSEQNKEEE